MLSSRTDRCVVLLRPGCHAPDNGVKAVLRHRVDHYSYRVVFFSGPEPRRTDRSSANLDGRVPQFGSSLPGAG